MPRYDGVLETVAFASHGQFWISHTERHSAFRTGKRALQTVLRCSDSVEIGTLARNKAANFVVLTRDPLADIRDLRSVEIVVKHGKPYPRSKYVPTVPTSSRQHTSHGVRVRLGQIDPDAHPVALAEANSSQHSGPGCRPGKWVCASMPYGSAPRGMPGYVRLCPIMNTQPSACPARLPPRKFLRSSLRAGHTTAVPRTVWSTKMSFVGSAP